MSLLTFYFEPENDWDGKLTATVTSNEFKAKGSAWFNTNELRQFAEELSAYPLPLDALPSLASGVWAERGRLERTHLAVSVAPYGLRGLVRFTVNLATDDLGETLGCNATVRFLATYADLSAFSAEVASLADGVIASASLYATAEK